MTRSTPKGINYAVNCRPKVLIGTHGRLLGQKIQEELNWTD